MGTDGRALFDDDDRQLAARFRRELLQTDRRRQTGRAGTDDDDVEFHRLAGGQLGCGVDLGLGHRLFEPLISRELR